MCARNGPATVRQGLCLAVYACFAGGSSTSRSIASKKVQVPAKKRVVRRYIFFPVEGVRAAASSSPTSSLNLPMGHASRMPPAESAWTVASRDGRQPGWVIYYIEIILRLRQALRVEGAGPWPATGCHRRTSRHPEW